MDITGLVLVAGMILVGFFFVAGLEIAYTDLRDKDPGQVSSNVRALLKDMQQHEEIVYVAREWLGVILIVIFAYISDFETIFIPWLGERHWRLRFTLLFTTVPLTWLAQGPAKRLAARNSEQFLSFARPMWADLRRLVYSPIR